MKLQAGDRPKHDDEDDQERGGGRQRVPGPGRHLFGPPYPPCRKPGKNAECERACTRRRSPAPLDLIVRHGRTRMSREGSSTGGKRRRPTGAATAATADVDGKTRDGAAPPTSRKRARPGTAGGKRQVSFASAKRRKADPDGGDDDNNDDEDDGDDGDDDVGDEPAVEDSGEDSEQESAAGTAVGQTAGKTATSVATPAPTTEGADESESESDADTDVSGSDDDGSQSDDDDDDDDETGDSGDAEGQEGVAAADAEGVVRLSAATFKTRMSPSMLQNPTARQTIWANVMLMMQRRGYRWEPCGTAPTAIEQLLPNNKGVLGLFHMRAVDATDKRREPVHVIFCSKAGEPTLRSMSYPSRHMLLVADSLTGRARAVLQTLALKAPPPAAVAGEGESWTWDALFMEAFASVFFMFDLLRQRYLSTIEFSPLAETDPELARVMGLFERGDRRDRFPRMLDVDPVARYLRVPLGSVVKQTRLSSSAGRHASYRCLAPAAAPAAAAPQPAALAK